MAIVWIYITLRFLTFLSQKVHAIHDFVAHIYLRSRCKSFAILVVIFYILILQNQEYCVINDFLHASICFTVKSSNLCNNSNITAPFV